MIRCIGISVVASILLLAGAARAASPCAAQLIDLCAHDAKTPEEFVRCARESDALLSEACRTELAAARRPAEERRTKRREQIRMACTSDVERLCEGSRGRRAIARCLERHREQVSDGCLAVAARFLARHAS